METFIFITILMFIGYLFKKYEIFPPQTSEVLNLYIIYISLPAMVFVHVPKIEFSNEIIIPIFIAFVVTFFGALTVYIISKLFSWDNKITGVVMLVGVLGNTSFLGIPIVQYYYSTEALPYVMIYDQLGTFLLLNTYGAVIIAIYSNNDKIIYKNIIKKIFLFPPFIALLIAFLLNAVEFNNSVNNILSNLANTLVPVALISVGYSLQLKIPKSDLAPFIMALSTKLVFIPIYAFVLVYIFEFEGLSTNVSILESAMAPMITAGAVASIAGFDSRLSSSIIAYGILISFFTTYVVFNFI